MANTPGGGALILGIDDRSGDLLGAVVDADWLRQRIFGRIDVAPWIEERIVDGIRLLILYVAEAREPVEVDSVIRWRVGDQCQRVDRAEWWLRRQDVAGFDPMAAATTRTARDITPGSDAAARSIPPMSSEPIPPEVDSTASLLTWLGVLRPDGRLSQAGALLFCASDRAYLELAVWDVEGGEVIAFHRAMSGQSLIEQIVELETRLDTLNTSITVRDGFREDSVRRLPPRAVREAVLNAVIHRDWHQAEPVRVTWIQEDSTLVVTSPGGFVDGVTPENALTRQRARHPALADAFRALRLVEKQGMGIDRMTREMVVLGHRPPLLEQLETPAVRVRLRGGAPALPVLDVVSRIRPRVRQADVRVALILYTLLHRPFVTETALQPILQRSIDECADALAAAAECRVDGRPLIVGVKDMWMLSPTVLEVVEHRADREFAGLRGRGILWYRRPDEPRVVVDHWLETHERITSGDYATMTGYTQQTALSHLDRLVDAGHLERGEGRGRNAHFRAGRRG